MVNFEAIPFKMNPQQQSNTFTWYGKFANARADIPLRRQVTLHHAVARIFFIG
jgi:hypothetical protein